MKVFSMFSGVGGFEIGYQKLGWETVGLCEFNKYSSQVLKHHYPEVRNYGDATKIIPGELPDFDILVGGFPCQAFSIAGKRKGLEDTRGTLFYDIARIAAVKKPTFLLLENVAGLLSHDKGRTFGLILETLGEVGYVCEWAVYNGKYFGVPQNRERVFIVGTLAERRESKVLLIGENGAVSNQENRTGGGQPQTEICAGSCRSTGQMKADSTFVVNDRGTLRECDTANCIDANYNKGIDNHGARTQILASRGRGEGWKQQLEERKDGNTNSLTSVTTDNLVQIGNVDTKGNNSIWGRVYSTEGIAPNINSGGGGLGAKTGLYAVKPVQLGQSEKTFAFKSGTIIGKEGQEAFTLRSCNPNAVSIESPKMLIASRDKKGNEVKRNAHDIAGTVKPPCRDNQTQFLQEQSQSIRRLTPLECERLMSWPDNWTAKGVNDKGEVVDMSDSQRYKQCGNGVISNCVEYICRLIDKEVNS